MSAKRTVTVIGGGVIGLTTAYALVRSGHQVKLIEREGQVGSQASYANGGQLSYRYVRPLADAGVPSEALSWIFRPESPISLKLNMDWQQWRWLGEFLLACNRSTNQKNYLEILNLSLKSQKTLNLWRSEGLDNFLWRQPGKLVIYRSKRKFLKAAKAVSHSENEQVLTPAQCTRLEPAFSGIASSLSGGIFSPDDEVADCYLFCQSLLKELLKRENFSLITGEATFEPAENQHCQIRIDGQSQKTDLVVLAAGMTSRDLVQPLGISLPLYGLKGYSLTVQASPELLPNISVTDYDNRIVYARLGEKLRVAAMVDIGAQNTTPAPRRIETLKALASRTLPEAGPYDSSEIWSGLRPATPTGVPIIGKTQYRNLLLNVGHGALGFTLSCGSAETILNIIEGIHS
ncbi:MAG: FAD-dependent oxidoreductase [Acetobacter sp.]|jgi:D-amino-acid dehydrogenase